MEVGDNKVIVLADTAERAEEIDVDRAEAARRRAEESIASRQGTIDLEEAQASLRRANLRLRIGQRRGSRRPPVPSGEGFPGSGARLSHPKRPSSPTPLPLVSGEKGLSSRSLAGRLRVSR